MWKKFYRLICCIEVNFVLHHRCPVAVPGVRLADGAAALHTDCGHSLPIKG